MKRSRVQDITLDNTLMQYLAHGRVPEEKAAEFRVKRAAAFLKLDDEGKLWAKNPSTGVSLYILPIH